MIKLIWRTDAHMSDHTPRSRKDDWTEAVFSNLRQVGAIASRVEADAIIDGGDYFDIKRPSKNSHALVRRTIEEHRSYSCPTYVVPGNHDCLHGDYSNLPKQPLGVLYEAGAFRRLYDDHEATIEKDGIKVRVVGIPYHGTKYDRDRFRIEKGDEDFLVVAAHVLASKKGGSMFEGEDIIKYDELLELAPDVDVFCFGHWHKNQGVTEIAPGKFVINVGSLSRGSISQDNLSRIPSCVELTFSDTFSYTVHELQVPPAEEVFDVEGKQREEQRESTMEEFVSSIRTTLSNVSSRPLSEVLDDLSGEVPDIVKERTRSYLEEALT